MKSKLIVLLAITALLPGCFTTVGLVTGALATATQPDPPPTTRYVERAPGTIIIPPRRPTVSPIVKGVIAGLLVDAAALVGLMYLHEKVLDIDDR